jgi:plasmid stability protein
VLSAGRSPADSQPIKLVENHNGTVMVFKMPTITLKNLPRDLHRQLKNRARTHHRSLNKEVIATLQDATAGTRPLEVEAMNREAREARAKFKRVIAVEEISAWKKQGRL